MLGRSVALCAARRLIARATTCDASVVIEGETGTGKELAARAIHYEGCRHAGPFIPINCGAIPDALIENELFGHKRGAFTDARADWSGLIRMAHGGTLFLDEVDALTPKGQVALLRFLQDQKLRPLGSTAEYTADVRVVAASNQNLAGLAERGRFRIDLLYRLRVLPITLPPLRERQGDIPLLAEHFVKECSGRYKSPRKTLSGEFLERLELYRWPGNVRELENVVHRGFLLSDGDTIAGDMFDLAPKSPEEPVDNSYRAAKVRALQAFDRRFLSTVMARAHGNVSAAATTIGKERRALGKLLKKYGIDPRQYRDA